ncbi:uncharacterized protein LOC116245058 [Nymphaea colorata]|uniref:uncharacterized protein LOC116245058 n=1 Tax=Nymphaea colorata TaxID=210225 RepID=UPI00129EAD08|nr:uncharacterized protein LOC116245058 [Nymphaea colorata]
MPVYAYYSQMMLIRKEKSIGSFSIYVCAILLISNILRIFFWLTIGYAVNLLFQSIFVIAIMIIASRKPASSKGFGSGKPMKNIAIGFLSMSIEATLGFPQLISNLKTKSVKGLSYTMIGMWFLGDFAKTVYFVTERSTATGSVGAPELPGVSSPTVDLNGAVQVGIWVTRGLSSLHCPS